MPMITVMTELEAVNEMLMSIGQAPVSTLEVTGIKDVNIAKAELLKVSRRIQTYGFDFNTDTAYEITPDVDGHVVVPAGALRVDPTAATNAYTVRREDTKGLCLYDKDEQSFVFTDVVEVDIVWGFAFEDMPEPARSYIATSAGRKFQSRVIGSQILDRFQAEDEARAWSLLLREERGSRDTNLFRANASMAGFFNRRY